MKLREAINMWPTKLLRDSSIRIIEHHFGGLYNGGSDETYFINLANFVDKNNCINFDLFEHNNNRKHILEQYIENAFYDEELSESVISLYEKYEGDENYSDYLECASQISSLIEKELNEVLKNEKGKSEDTVPDKDNDTILHFYDFEIEDDEIE